MLKLVWTGLSVALVVIGVWGASCYVAPQQVKFVVAENTTAYIASQQDWKPLTVGHPTFCSPHASPIKVIAGQVFVANTPADTVDVVDQDSLDVVRRINVGIDPVSLAVRPDGKELWVSNHVSDSVSVIDTNNTSPTYLHVIATVQEINPTTKATEFDEPVGIAFASNEKAYVALSSENRIAVVDVATREVIKRIRIPAQDPRAIKVRGDRLYVIPFESNNKTQLSGGYDLDDDLVTFNAHEHSVANNNVLSLGAVLDIIKHPEVPDRDLFVFDTKTDKLVETVDTLGTLLYGLTVDSQGTVFVAQTDARNDANGLAGTKNHGLKELENRAFLNRITTVRFDGDEAEAPSFVELEPLPPIRPAVEDALATPFAIQISDDDRLLVVSAAGSDKLITVNADSGEVLGATTVGSVPRGIALDHDSDGDLTTAWVLNAVANSVSRVDLSDVAAPKQTATVRLEDPTHPTVKQGRIAFNSASASTTGTFSCASCHPDGHTDQLLWVLKTPIVTGGDQIMPRSTMPIRGLRDTAPYHWDGIPGDPYGGNNSANVHGSDEPNAEIDDPTSTTRHLIDGGLASTMALEGDDSVNDEGKPGKFSAVDRDAMATFLLSVPYPPAQKRAYTNELSSQAEKGFRLFHIEGDLQGEPTPNVCGDCHRMPFLVSTNTPGTGMDAPTWRGAYDRFLILPQGRLNIIDFDFFRSIAEHGTPERNLWQFSWAGRRRFDPVWDMVLEFSTGYSGSFARQITLNASSVNSELLPSLVNALELSAREGAIVLEVDAALIGDEEVSGMRLQFDPHQEKYVATSSEFTSMYSRGELIEMARRGELVGTLTARHGEQDDVNNPQPGIWTQGPIEKQRGRQQFPVLYRGSSTMTVSGRHLHQQPHVIVDGRKVDGEVRIGDHEKVEIEFARLPSEGMHLLQLQNQNGMFTNDFIFHVTSDAEAAEELRRQIARDHVEPTEALGQAVIRGDLDEVRFQLAHGASIDAQREDGSTPLSTAALYGQTEVTRLLLKEGAKVDALNRDGNTPLHVAAFLCRTDIVKQLLHQGASMEVENGRGETPIDVISAEWSTGIANFYRGIGRGLGIAIDLEQIRDSRPRILTLLRNEQSDR